MSTDKSLSGLTWRDAALALAGLLMLATTAIGGLWGIPAMTSLTESVSSLTRDVGLLTERVAILTEHDARHEARGDDHHDAFLRAGLDPGG